MELSPSEIQHLVTLGSLAPSGGNVQPWRVRARPQALDLYLDPVRSSSFIDVERYASIFSLGSFTENIVLASEAAGLLCHVEFLGFQNIDRPLAHCTYSERIPPDDQQDHLARYIPSRVTNRKLLNASTIPAAIINALQELVAQHGLCQLWMRSDIQSKQQAARILGAADAIRIHHPQLHEQMFAELRWNKQQAQHTRDGIEIGALELSKTSSFLLSGLRSYALAKHIPRQALISLPKPALLACSHIACLSIQKPINPQTIFESGRVFQRLWLFATREQLALHPWTVLPFFLIRAMLFSGTGFSSTEEKQILELGQALRQVFGMPDTTMPLFIFRLSHAIQQPSSRSLRIPWEQFTEIIDSH